MAYGPDEWDVTDASDVEEVIHWAERDGRPFRIDLEIARSTFDPDRRGVVRVRLFGVDPTETSDGGSRITAVAD